MMLHDVAAGMSYLHGRNHIHGDLRSPNLFVGADGKVKIGECYWLANAAVADAVADAHTKCMRACLCRACAAGA